jgi:thiamine-phosphate diphosphorylase
MSLGTLPAGPRGPCSARIVLITDPAFGDDAIVRCVQEVAAALPSGALCVQLRDKGRALTSLRMFAWRLRIVSLKAGASLVVNGDPRLARDVGADGVHLGVQSGGVGEARSLVGRRTWVSISAHSDDDVARAVRDGADAVLVSPVFATRPASLQALRVEKAGRGVQAIQTARVLAAGRVAVFALGGVTPENAARCARAGAEGVAVMKCLLGSPRPAGTAKAIHDALACRW